MNINDSDVNRLLTTFQCKQPDRVPVFEYWITSQTIIEYVLGRPTQSEIIDASRGESSITPADEVEYALRVGMDAVGANFPWRPNNIFRKASDGIEHYIDGGIKTMDDFKHLDPPTPLMVHLERLDRYLEAAKGTGVGVYANLTSFFDSCYLAMGVQDFLMKTRDDLPLIEHLMDLLLERQLQAMEAVCKYPEVAFVFINDDIAFHNGLFIQPDLFRSIFVPRMKKLVAPARKAGKILTFHTDGDLRDVIPILLDLGFSALQPIEPWSNDIYKLKEQYKGKLCLMGNIDTGILAFSAKDEIEKDVKEHIDKLADGGGYVLGSCTSIFEGIPPENYQHMVEVGVKYGREVYL